MTRIRIGDPRSLGSWCIKGTDESVIWLQSLFLLMHHELSDPGSLIQIKMIPKEHVHLSSKALNGFQKSSICMKLNKQVKDIFMSGSSFPKKNYLNNPQYDGEIWKRGFISTVRPTVYTSTNPSRKRSFSKTLFKPEEFENAGFAFSFGRKTFWKLSFSKTMASR